MQRWQTSTMLLPAVFSDALRTVRCLDLPRIWLLSPTNLAFGFGHSDHKMIATNDKRTINHLWSFETFVVLMDVASCGTETLGAAYMNGYFNAEIALKIGGPGQAVTISYDLLFYRGSSLKSVTVRQLNQKWMNTQVIREYPRSLITSFLLQRFVHAFNLCSHGIWWIACDIMIFIIFFTMKFMIYNQIHIQWFVWSYLSQFLVRLRLPLAASIGALTALTVASAACGSVAYSLGA